MRAVGSSPRAAHIAERNTMRRVGQRLGYYITFHILALTMRHVCIVSSAKPALFWKERKKSRYVGREPRWSHAPLAA